MTKILLVEDDKSLREIYGVRLLAEGYEIVSAGDGEEALAMAIKEKPDLIVSDVMMPKISGFDMLDILRSTPETKDVKIIMMTALSSEDQRARGESLGANRYLVKSQVGIEDVVRSIHDVLADVPASPASAQNTFGTPAPSAVASSPVPTPPTPVSVPEPTPAAPVEPAQAAPAPATPVTPVAPVQPPAPAPTIPAEPPVNTVEAPQTAPMAPPVINTQPDVPPTPVAPAPTQTVTPPPIASMPQPTAPFSSPRPGTPEPTASMGEDRVMQPLNGPETPKPDIATMMNQELNSNDTPTQQA